MPTVPRLAGYGRRARGARAVVAPSGGGGACEAIHRKKTPQVRIHVRSAVEDDLGQLAVMNERLVIDQGSIPWPVERFRERFAEWVGTGEWSVDVFVRDGQVVGYAAYQTRGDHYVPSQQVVFLRHFYIERGLRGQGVGTAAFGALAGNRFPQGLEVALEVEPTNPAGQRFWERLGFGPYFTAMKMEPDK